MKCGYYHISWGSEIIVEAMQETGLYIFKILIFLCYSFNVQFFVVCWKT